MAAQALRQETRRESMLRLVPSVDENINRCISGSITLLDNSHGIPFQVDDLKRGYHDEFINGAILY